MMTTITKEEIERISESGTNGEVFALTALSLQRIGIPDGVIDRTFTSAVEKVVDFSRVDEPCCKEMMDICNEHLEAAIMAQRLADAFSKKFGIKEKQAPTETHKEEVKEDAKAEDDIKKIIDAIKEFLEN